MTPGLRGASARLRRLLGAPRVWLRIAWWGLVRPRLEREALVVHQAVVRSPRGVLLSVREDLQGWELPGGEALPGESGEQAVAREVREETGVEVEVLALVADYLRSGFRPHTARVWLCRQRGGQLAASPETPRVQWWGAAPRTLFPWYRQPLADALALERGERPCGQALRRRERWGLRAILTGVAIDLRMRWSGEASLPRDPDGGGPEEQQPPAG